MLEIMMHDDDSLSVHGQGFKYGESGRIVYVNIHESQINKYSASGLEFIGAALMLHDIASSATTGVPLTELEVPESETDEYATMRREGYKLFVSDPITAEITTAGKMFVAYMSLRYTDLITRKSDPAKLTVYMLPDSDEAIDNPGLRGKGLELLVEWSLRLSTVAEKVNRAEAARRESEEILAYVRTAQNKIRDAKIESEEAALVAEDAAEAAQASAQEAASSATLAAQSATDAKGAAQTAQAAKDAAVEASHPPYIGDNGNWYVWSTDVLDFIDSGKPSRGEKGNKGDKGDKGNPGYTPQRGTDYFTEEDKAEWKTTTEKLVETAVNEALGVQGGSIDLPEKDTLENMSWSDISKVCRAGYASKYFEVGDKKTITCGSSTYIVDLIDFDHDTPSDIISYGRSRAGVTFALHGVASSSPMSNPNSSDPSNTKGWDGSYMRNTKLASVFEELADDLKSVIVSVNKLTSIGGMSSELALSEDNLFLLAESEIFSNITYSAAGEGAQYAYYYTGNSEVKESLVYWLRSPSVKDNENYCFVGKYGGAGAAPSHYWQRISFAFCV